MKIIIKIILSILVLLAGMLGAGTRPYLPSWIGLKASVGIGFISLYIIYKIWAKNQPKKTTEE